MADNNSADYNVTVFERIASGGPETINAAQSMLRSYGYDEASDRQDLKDALVVAAVEKGEDALKKMANFHPDKEFILANVTPVAITTGPLALSSPSNTFVHAAGKSPCSSNHHNDCGCNKKYSDIGHTGTAISPAAAADISASNKAGFSDIANFAIILLLSMGFLGLLSMMMGQVFLHMIKKG